MAGKDIHSEVEGQCIRGKRSDDAEPDPDPYDFINILLDGRTIGPKNNINTAYFDKPAYNRKMDAAARLAGDARYRAYGNLDIDITRNQSPLVISGNQNVREFISSKVGCPTYSFAWGGLNIVMLCPKR